MSPLNIFKYQWISCLYQYVKEHYKIILNIILPVENIGVEPMTSCVQGRRSSQLS